MAASDGTLPLAKTFVGISLTSGLNRKSDSHKLQNGELLTAENVSFSQVDGQICKRNGFAPVTPQGAPFQGGPFKALGCRDNIEPLILGANTLNKYNTAQNLSTAIPTPTQGRVDVNQIVGSTGQSNIAYPPTDASTATDGNQYACVTWQEPNITGAFIFYGIQDLNSGSWIIPPTGLANQASSLSFAGGLNTTFSYTFVSHMSPKVQYSDGYFYISVLWCGQSGTGDNSYQAITVFYALPLTNLAGGLKRCNYAYRIEGATTANSFTSPNPNGYDFHISGTNFIVAVLSQANTGNVNYNYGNVVSGQLQQTSNGSVSMPFSQNQRIAAKCDGPAAYPLLIAGANSISYGLPGQTFTTVRAFGVGSPLGYPVDCMWAGNGDCVWIGYNASASFLQVIAVWVDPRTNVITRVPFLGPMNTFHMQVLSRMWMVSQNNKVYVWLGCAAPSSDSVYNSAFLVEYDFSLLTATVVCRTLYLKNSHIMGGSQTFPCEVLKLPKSSRYVTFVSSALEKVSDGFRSYGALNRIQFNFAPARGPQIIPLPTGGNMICGAYPLYYDGATICEAGFSSAPSADPMMGTSSTALFTPPFVSSETFGLVGGPSAVTPSGFIEYYYVVCLVRRDAYGNVYRSAPSSVITVQCPNAFNSVTFQPFTYNQSGSVQIEYYRSTQGTPGTHYFLGQVANGRGYTDRKADGSTAPGQNNSITKNRTVYTNAGEVINDPPPPVHHAAISETRMYIIPSDNRNLIWYSKQFAPGRTVEFSGDLTMSEGQNSGQFTALAVLDDKLIIFKQDQVLYTYGNGPDNSGKNGAFAPFVKIASDVGCVEAASVCVIPDGVVFKSRRGIELLTRQLQVVYIGGNVEPLVQTNGPLSSVVVMPNFTELRFIPAQATATTTYQGVTATIPTSVLVYEYAGKRWSTYTNMAATQAVAINNDYWWISADGALVNRETPGQYLDNTQPILMTLETPEIPCGSGGNQGWGRIYRMALLGDFYGAHKLLLSLAYDHQTAYTDTITFDTTSGLIPGDIVYQFRASRLPRSVMQTLRLKIQDTANVGQSCAISSLVLEVASKNGLAKLSPAKTL
jgi:hypothetical protein